MNDVIDATVRRQTHGHHGIAAAIFVGSMILSGGLILSAELMKPERYEFHPSINPTSYVIFDRDTGRATAVDFDSKTPTAALTK